MTESKTTAKKARKATKANTTRRQSRATTTTRPHERDPAVIATDAAYALAGLATDALHLANEAIRYARTLPEKAQDRAQELRGTNVEARLRESREELEKKLRDVLDKAEDRFDEKATEGRTATEELLSDERLRRVVDQAKVARSQVKGALTSIRKTTDTAVSAGVEAGRAQARKATSQTKAAATSVQKTVDEAVDAAKDATREDN
jgi:hypothetical protein